MSLFKASLYLVRLVRRTFRKFFWKNPNCSQWCELGAVFSGTRKVLPGYLAGGHHKLVLDAVLDMQTAMQLSLRNTGVKCCCLPVPASLYVLRRFALTA